MRIDRVYVIFAMAYAVIGIGLGIFMAATHNPMQHVTHAHILLVGFVMSFIYAVIHRLWLDQPGRMIAIAQFITHQVGAVGIMIGLFLLYGRFVMITQIEGFLAASAISVLLGLLLMIYMLVVPGNQILNEPSNTRTQ